MRITAWLQYRSLKVVCLVAHLSLESRIFTSERPNDYNLTPWQWLIPSFSFVLIGLGVICFCPTAYIMLWGLVRVRTHAHKYVYSTPIYCIFVFLISKSVISIDFSWNDICVAKV